MRYLLLFITIPVFVIDWVIGIIMAILAFLMAYINANLLDTNGNITQPFLRALFQPRDNPAIGDKP
jgi:hypothetical protein